MVGHIRTGGPQASALLLGLFAQMVGPAAVDIGESGAGEADPQNILVKDVFVVSVLVDVKVVKLLGLDSNQD